MTGRPAALPVPGQRPHTLRASDGLLITHRSSADGQISTWDLSNLPVGPAVQRHFAECFGRAVGPSGTLRSRVSATKAWYALQTFAQVLQRSERPPRTPGELRPGHLLEFRLEGKGPRLESTLKALLRRCIDGYTVEFNAALRHPAPVRTKAPKESYSERELRRVLRAAREDVRAARDRVRRSQAHLDRWRQGAFEHGSVDWHLGEVIQHVATRGDVPRWTDGKVNFKVLGRAGIATAGEALALRFLGAQEVIAFWVLLVGLTGQNSGTIARTPAAHHRADADTGAPRVATVDLLKPRRGPSRARMSVSLTDVPRWLADAAAFDKPDTKELASPLGVYLLLLELTEAARSFSGSGQAFTWRATKGGNGVGGGFRTRPPADEHRNWSRRHDLRGDDGGPLVVDFGTLRLTVQSLRDEPVAQTRRTMHSDYQLRDRTDLARYQRVVATTLDERVSEARDTLRLSVLSPQDVEEAADNPELVAVRLGVSVKTLKAVLSGRLDTVLTACSDNENGPVTPGRACEGSFLLCTACPCAVSLPTHLVVQVAAHDALLHRRSMTAPHDWVERFGGAWARLNDLIGRHPVVTVTRAREQVTAEHRALIERLLAGEFDA